MTDVPPSADPRVFRSLFDAYPDGVLLVDGQGLIVLANPAVCTLLGFPVEALVGQSVDMLVPRSVTPRHAAYRRGYALAPKARPMGTELELRARRADGGEVMVEIALSPMHVGGVAYVVTAVRGVGAYPRVRRAMQRSRYNEFVAKLGHVAVDTLDPSELLRRMPEVAVEALQVEAVAVYLLTPNHLELHVASYFGPKPEQALRVTHPNRPDTMVGYVVAQRAPVICANVARETRFEVPKKLLADGMQSFLGVPLNDRGKIIGVLGARSHQLRRFGDDEVLFLESLASMLSTSLQRAEAETYQRHAQRLEAVGQLTGGIAHDFNNLLTVIQGNLQILTDQDAVRGDALLQQLVASATRAGQRGADLTGKLLAFSRRQALAPSAVDPSAMLESMADMLRRTLGEQVRVVVVLPAFCPMCLIDAVQLESALLNVAINARDAMPDGGTLTLSCGTRPPLQLPVTGMGALDDTQDGTAHVDDAAGAAADADAWVWFSIQDTGTGMSADVRDRVFEPFFTTKEAGRGTGMGLSTVYGFIKQSRGSIHIDSTPGAGTTVTMFLPALSDMPHEDLPGASAVAPLRPGLRVLLVEDDADVRGVAQSFLQTLGCRATPCASPEEALAQVAQGARFDLLFSDITLGSDIDGIALARRITQQRGAAAALLTSGYSRYLAGAREALPWAVLKKPYTREELALAITQCLAGAPLG